jgi:hypothetical protein
MADHGIERVDRPVAQRALRGGVVMQLDGVTAHGSGDSCGWWVMLHVKHGAVVRRPANACGAQHPPKAEPGGKAVGNTFTSNLQQVVEPGVAE